MNLLVEHGLAALLIDNCLEPLAPRRDGTDAKLSEYEDIVRRGNGLSQWEASLGSSPKLAAPSFSPLQ